MVWLKYVFIGLVVIYLLGGLGLYLFQEKIIFLPEPLEDDFQYSFDSSFEEVKLEMADGALVNALHFKVENPKGIIIYFHGNAGNLERWGEIVSPLTKYGYEVFAIDYRGYGKSTGKRTKAKMLSDADAAYEYVKERWEEEKITVFGRSLGGSFATYVAGRNQPKQVILEAPFFSTADLARRFAWMYPTTGILRFNFQNHKSLKTATCPITIIHGTEDEVVPLDSGQKLFRSVDGDNAEFIEVAGGEHNDLSEFDLYSSTIERLLK